MNAGLAERKPACPCLEPEGIQKRKTAILFLDPPLILEAVAESACIHVRAILTTEIARG